MQDITDHISLTVLDGAQGITQAGFGTQGICEYHERWAGTEVREYTSEEGMLSDGFAATGPSSGPFLAAKFALAQNPRPKSVKVGNRAAAPTQITRLTPTAQGTGYVHTLEVKDTAAVSNGGVVSYTEQGGDDADAIATALQALLDALTTDASFTDATGSILATGQTDGIWTRFEAVSRSLYVEDETVDAGIAADLAAMNVADPDWYGLSINSPAGTEIAAAAAWAASNGKMFGAGTRDDEVADTSETDDVATTLQGLTNKRAFLVYAKEEGSREAGAAALGMLLAREPGTYTAKFKSLVNVGVSNLTATQFSTLKAKSCNYYVRTAGVNMLGEGVVCGDSWIDETILKDKASARTIEAMFSVLVNTEKTEYTNLGVETLCMAGLAAMQRMESRPGAPNAFVRGSCRYEFTDVNEDSKNDVANRVVKNIRFFATLTGAVHEIDVATLRLELPGS